MWTILVIIAVIKNLKSQKKVFMFLQCQLYHQLHLQTDTLNPTIYFRQVTYLQKYSDIFKHTFIFISSFSEVTSEIISFCFNIFLYPNSFSSFGNLVCQNLYSSPFLLVGISITIGRCSQRQIYNLLSSLNLHFGLYLYIYIYINYCFLSYSSVIEAMFSNTAPIQKVCHL